MARQKLIHLHTSGTTQSKSVLTSGNYALELGEIAVQHNAEAAKIYVRLSDAQGAASENIAEFIDATAVDAKITTALAQTTTDLSNLRTVVGDGIQGKSLTQAINDANDSLAAEISARTAADTTLDGRIDEVVGDLADEASARTAADDAINAKIGGSFNSTNTVAAAISGLETSIGNVNTALGTETTNRQNADKAIEDVIGSGFTSADTITERMEAVEAAIGIDGGENSISDRVEALETGLANEVSARTDADSTHTANIAQNATNIAAINTKLGEGFSEQSTVASQLAAVKGTADTALQSISKGTDGTYVTTTVGEKGQGTTQTVGVAVTVQAMSTADASHMGLAEASDVKTYVDGKDTAMDRRVDALETDNTTIKGQLSGLSTDSGSVKKYVDDQVSAQVAAAYKVKGTVADYAALEGKTSTAVVGDVWNMTASATVDGKVYPAGTNWVYTEEGWDALGGTVDLSPFMQTADFNTWSAGTYTTDKQNLENSVTTERTNRSNADTEIKAIIGNYTTANTVQAAIEAISSADSANHDLITAETENRTTADTAIRNLIGDGFDSGSTATTVAGKVKAAQDKADQNANDIDALEAALGTGFSQSSTVASQLGAVKTTADGAVQSVSVSGITGVTATEDASTHDVALDFTDMVIDCGSY